MQIWLDNDGCPRIVRDVTFKAAQRKQIKVNVVGNSWMRIPEGPLFQMITVPGSFDAADQKIVELCNAGDLVITADIPLAALVIAKGTEALSPRGEVFDASNVQERLTVRNLMAELRSAGEIHGGPPSLNDLDKKRFADGLDRLLQRLSKG